MQKTKDQLIGEIRYAQRICQRTARLYRRASTSFTFLSILAGSGALASIYGKAGFGLTAALALIVAALAAANHAIRPAEKIAANEADNRKYSTLMAKVTPITNIAEIEKLIAEARQSDTPEIEPLRDVAYNDVVIEMGMPEAIVPLTFSQRLLGALA